MELTNGIKSLKLLQYILSKKAIIEHLKEKLGSVKKETFDFENIRKYFDRKSQKDCLQVISEKTCQDLDFEELFMYLDRTHSRVGQQKLYDRLRKIHSRDKSNWELEQRITLLKKDEDLRGEIQYLLSQLNKPEAFYISGLFQQSLRRPPQWFVLIRALPLVNLLMLGLCFYNLQFLLPFLLLTLVHLVLHYWNKRNVTEYVSSLPQLIRLNQVAKKILQKQAFGWNKQNMEQAIGVIDRVRNKMSFFRLEARLQGDFEAFIWAVLEIMKIVLLLEPLLLFNVLRSLENKKKDIEQVFEFVGSVDVALSVYSLRAGQDIICTPSITKRKKELAAEEMCHPLIEDCVTNSFHVKDRSMLLTGSNMSGKTSFIRTLGVNALTALTLHTCFSRKFEMPVMRIHSAIRITDDLVNDKSFYFEEVMTVRNMIEAGREQPQNLFLLDEIYKGTNTIERIAGGKAVLSYLNRGDDLVFVSTHDIELTDYLIGQYDLYHFTEEVDNGSVNFDYKLKRGKLYTRNALRILEINGYPDEVIREATELAGEITQTSVRGE